MSVDGLNKLSVASVDVQSRPWTFNHVRAFNDNTRFKARCKDTP